MAIIEMKKLLLFGLIEEKVGIFKVLQEMGNVEIQEIEDQVDTYGEGLHSLKDQVDGAESYLSKVRFALDFLGRYNREKRGMFDGRPTVTMDGLSEVMDNRIELLKIADKCRGLEDELTVLRTRKTRLNNLISQLTPWSQLDVALKDLRDTQKTRVVTGSVDKEKVSMFEESLQEQHQEVLIHPVGSGKEETNYLVIFHRDEDEAISSIFKEQGFNRISFNDLSGTPRDIIAMSEKELNEIDEEQNEIGKRAELLIPHKTNIEVLYDGLNIELEKERSGQKLLLTGKTFMLKGWVPASDEKYLIEKLTEVTNAFSAEFEVPKEREVFPVALNNPALVKPFEMVTSLYSTPHHRGLDPNIYMAPFYFAFFGMMVSDAGYGLVLALVAAFLTKKLKLKGNGRKLGWLISLGGVSTFLWGALFGGWFGDAGTAIAQLFGLENAAIWFDPMEEPLLMLGLCFGLGLVQVFVGMGLQAYINIKRGRVMDAVYDQGLWYMLIIGFILLATEFASIGKIMAIGGAIGLVLTQGRHQTSIIKKVMSGVLSLYNVTGFLSDILSYSRLFALGLATGVIAMVINQLGVMLGTSWYGWIMAVLILIGGHIFNILINVLGAFVHASRLQYIEFFGKFFEGGGHAFQPLSIKTKFIDLIEKEAI